MKALEEIVWGGGEICSWMSLGAGQECLVLIWFVVKRWIICSLRPLLLSVNLLFIFQDWSPVSCALSVLQEAQQGV